MARCVRQRPLEDFVRGQQSRIEHGRQDRMEQNPVGRGYGVFERAKLIQTLFEKVRQPFAGVGGGHGVSDTVRVSGIVREVSFDVVPRFDEVRVVAAGRGGRQYDVGWQSPAIVGIQTPSSPQRTPVRDQDTQALALRGVKRRHGWMGFIDMRTQSIEVVDKHAGGVLYQRAAMRERGARQALPQPVVDGVDVVENPRGVSDRAYRCVHGVGLPRIDVDDGRSRLPQIHRVGPHRSAMQEKLFLVEPVLRKIQGIFDQVDGLVPGERRIRVEQLMGKQDQGFDDSSRTVGEPQCRCRFAWSRAQAIQFSNQRASASNDACVANATPPSTVRVAPMT